MAKEPIIYDLVLLLSATAEDPLRGQILTEVEQAITAGGGTILVGQDWGRRPTTFPIGHQVEADYHLLQFSAPPAVLATLEHTLRIADAVLRFRIIKVTPGTPPVPDGAPPVLAGASDES